MPADAPFDDAALLRQARAKAAALLETLRARSADLARHDATLSPDRLANTRQAFDRAIHSAQRTLDELTQAVGDETTTADQ
ncbi:MAG TPA: hypothetical protein VEA69_22990 [Tepidisphaeraceae bacterium]|nr:hypothetical protein [Tepidisphaeraceae bacterium]